MILCLGQSTTLTLATVIGWHMKMSRPMNSQSVMIGCYWWLFRVIIAVLPVSQARPSQTLCHCDCLLWHSDSYDGQINCVVRSWHHKTTAAAQLHGWQSCKTFRPVTAWWIQWWSSDFWSQISGLWMEELPQAFPPSSGQHISSLLNPQWPHPSGVLCY